MRFEGKGVATAGLNEAVVTPSGQLRTVAEVLQAIAHVSEFDKNSFIMGTGFRTYAADTDGVLFYMKNTHATKDIHVQSIRTCAYNTVLTGANNWARWTLYKNPVSSDGGTTITPQNMNTASNNSITGTFKGGDSGTVTGNTTNPMAQWINPEPAHSTDKYEGALIVAPGDDIAVVGRLIIAGLACATVQCFYSG